MMPLLFAGGLILVIGVLWSKHPVLRALARLVTGLLTLASAAAMVFLFQVGQKVHWTSDGPGMLVIMMGVLLFGFLALVFGGLFLQSFNVPPSTGVHKSDHRNAA